MYSISERIEKKLGKKVVELTGDTTPDMKMVADSDLIVTTPEKWGKNLKKEDHNYTSQITFIFRRNFS